MALTVSNVVAEIVSRIEGKLSLVGISTTPDDSNTVLLGTVRKGLGFVGYLPADPSTVTDDDLADVTGWDVERLYDAATYEALILCLGRCNLVDQQVGPHMQRLSQAYEEIRSLLKVYAEKLARPNGLQMNGAVGEMADQPIPNDPFDVIDSRTSLYTWPYPR